MCGLCGILTPDGAAAQPEFGAAVERMTALMERRGPDDAGAWLSPDGRVRFGFRRLAILDLTAAAHQPMLTADGRYAIVCNGEVYNFRDLRAELERHGCTFRSTGDTEVVLQALVTWGPQALQRFNGMFALAFYDALTKRLLLARDPVGIKPLYYLAVSDHFVFASQYDQLLAHPASRNLSVDPDGLSLYLQLGYIPAPYAALRHTSMVEPGTYVEVDDSGKAQVTRYYEFPQYVRPDLTGDDACDAVHAAVTEAVKRQMVSDVPLGTFLSGGIDSPLVAALMASAASSTVRAYTIGTLGDALDESADASRYAEELGLHHVVEHFAPARAVELLDDVVQACGEPFADYSIFPTMLVARLARREVTVMLSGDGGDELFWGYPGRFGSVVESASAFGEPLWLRSARRAATRYLGVGNTSPNLRMKSIGHWYRAKHSHVPQGWLRRMVPDLPDWPAGCTLFDYTGSDPDRTAQWLRWNEFAGHLTRVLLKVDRASMYESLEVRVPLLDLDVVRVAMRVDWRSCLDLRTGTGKLPLRRALARYAKHQTSPKRGFGVPMSEWLRGPLRSLLLDELGSRSDVLGVPLRRQHVAAFVDEHLRGATDRGWGIWILLSLALWERRHYRRWRS